MVVEQTRDAVNRMNEALAALAFPYRVDLVDPAQVVRLAKNARFMTAEQFRALVENVKRDKGLSSVPFCVQEDGRYRCLSGNHRLDAAEAAGQKLVLILYTDERLTRGREVAIQLSHNAIVGQDDPATLKELWAELQEVSDKLYSGLDDAAMAELVKAGGSGLSPVRLDFKVVSFVMLPEEAAELERIFAAAEKQAREAGADTIHLAGASQFDRLLSALAESRKRKGVKNSAVALLAILDAWEKHQAEKQDGESGDA